MSELWVTVPVGERQHYLPGLLSGLKKHLGHVVFVNNHFPYEKYDGVHHVEDYEKYSIYHWWNVGIRYAEERGARYVAVLNDDLRFDENFLDTLLNHLKTNNLAVVDTENSGNAGGAAWLLDLSYGLRLDERFKWWYGDTHLFNEAKKLGKFERLHYGNFEHLEPNGNLYKLGDTLHKLVHDDSVLYSSLYN